MRDAKATARPAILKAQLTETALDFIHGLPSIVEVAGKSGHILAAEGSSEIPREFPDPAEVVTKEMPRPPTSCGRVRHNVSKRTQRAGRDIDSRRLRHSTDFVSRCSEDCTSVCRLLCVIDPIAGDRARCVSASLTHEPAGQEISWARRRSALPITLTLEKAMAAAAMTGDSRSPKTG